MQIDRNSPWRRMRGLEGAPPTLPKAAEAEVDAVGNGRRQAVAVRGGESVGLVKAAVAEGGRGEGGEG